MRYLLNVTRAAESEIRHLPGNYRQRIQRAVKALADEPRPSQSTALALDLDEVEPRRLRLDHWRVLYAVSESEVNRITVVAVRRRPPYRYDDLAELFRDIR